MVRTRSPLDRSPAIPRRRTFAPPDARDPRLSALLLATLAAAAGCNDSGEPTGTGESLPPFASAATCGSCHPQHLAEWEESMHAFGGVDPTMMAMADLASQEPGEKVGATCRACHAPALVRQEEWLASLPAGADPELEDLSQDGINCDVCHSVQIVPPVGDIDYLQDVDPHSPKLGGLRDPQPNDFHQSLHDNSYSTSIQCASCHQVNLNDGTGIENTFLEWQDANSAGMGQECQTCHMPAYTGQAATGGPVRDDVHRHWFTGVGYALEEFRGIDRNEQLLRNEELLRDAVRVETSVPAQVTGGTLLEFSVTVANHRTGHAIPSGTSFAREMWLDVAVKDESGATIYRSGALDAEDDLIRDPDLAFFGSKLLDANGDVTFFTWRAVGIDESKLLQFGQSRVASYSLVVPPGTPGPLSVETALRFRPLPPELVRDLGLERLLPIEIFTMWEASQAVSVN